jgi:hypothetical protein
MKLLNSELEARLPRIGTTEGLDPDVLVRFFHPLSDWSWYPLEHCPEDRMFFGLVDGFETEFGYFSLDELEELDVYGFGVEIDPHWTPKPLSELRTDLERNRGGGA